MGEDQSNILFSQMFEDEKLNKATGNFEKENNNKPHEYVTVIGNDGESVLTEHTSKLEHEVHLPKNIENLGIKNGVKEIIHNHPNSVPLPSYGDVYYSIVLRAEFLVTTTEKEYNSVLINKNRFAIEDEGLLKSEAKRVYDKFESLENGMKEEFINRNPEFENFNPKSDEFRNAIAKYYQIR